MHSTFLLGLCRIQLCLLILALPFEYFPDREQSLFTNLKVQIIALAVTWACLKAAEFLKFRGEEWNRLKGVLPRRLFYAMIVFVFIQMLAAAFAPAFQGNAAKAAAKAFMGVILAVIAADLSSERRSTNRPFSNVKTYAVGAVSLAGISMALLGFGDWIGLTTFTRIVNVFQPFKYWLGNSVRFVSTMEYPNTAASFLSAAMCATLALIVFRTAARRCPAWIQALLLAAIAILGAALSFTYSRGALCAAIIAVAVVSWIFRNHFRERNSRFALCWCGAVLFAGMAPSYLIRREATRSPAPPQKRVAHYGWESNAPTRLLLPDRIYEESLTVQNDSQHSWSSGEFGVAYRWHNLSNRQDSPLLEAAGFRNDIKPAQKSRVQVSLRTPARDGEYLLIWFIFRRSGGIYELKDSFSPGIMCTIRTTEAKKTDQLSSKAQNYVELIGKERSNLSKSLIPMRRELWSAAVRMFSARPILGLGPDNFRLRKREYMEVPKGDETILANSLYLELLSDSGILGLLSFLWMIWELGRIVFQERSAPEFVRSSGVVYFGAAYLTGFMAHGLVDYFLKFTPTFLLFWLMLGILGSRSAAGNGDAACE
jgi:hypothetical protein